MEPTFLSERDRRDQMLTAFYRQLNRHAEFRHALGRLANELEGLLPEPPGRPNAGHPGSDERDGPPGAAFGLLQAFAERWALPTDVGLLDLWDSICDGPRPAGRRPPHPNLASAPGVPSEAGAGRSPAPQWRFFKAFLRSHPPHMATEGVGAGRTPTDRRYRIRVGDRPLPGVVLTSAELDALTPQDIEPIGWRRPGPDLLRPGPAPQPMTGRWSDLLAHDPTGIVGDITRRRDIYGGPRRPETDQVSVDVVEANEARLQAQGFRRPGPRRRQKDLRSGAGWLFKRAVLRMRWVDIAIEEPLTNERTNEVAVRMTATRWADELKVPLPRGRTLRRI